MTIQAGDILSYNGEKTTIVTEPLKPYLEDILEPGKLKTKNFFLFL